MSKASVVAGADEFAELLPRTMSVAPFDGR